MAISIKGNLADKVQALLGGKNITEKRVESLLTEAEANRARIAELENLLASRADMSAPQAPRSPQGGELGGQAVPNLGAGLTEGELGAEADDWDEAEPTPEDPDVLARHLEVPLLPDVGNVASVTVDTGIAPPPHSAPPSPTLSPEMQAMQAMMEMVQVLKAEVQAMKAAPTEAEKKEAIAGGKLPSVIPAAGPTGYTGSAQLPRGRWFTPPIGPQHIQIRLCDCPKCVVKSKHYWCVMCKRGPFNFLGATGPKGRKAYIAPGSTWGLSHEVCSVSCWVRYLESIGVAPGINDAEPPSANPTEQPVAALGSD